MPRLDISSKSGLNVHIAPYTTTPIHSKRQMAARTAVCRLLACMLSVEGEVSYAHTPSGAPYLLGEHMPYLSISHTEGYVAVALSEHQPIGIDIERIGHQVARVVYRFLTPRELRLLPDNPKDWLLAVHLLWSAKEAAYKLTNPPSQSLSSFELVDALDTIAEGRQGTFVLSYKDTEAEDLQQCSISPRLITIDYTTHDDYVVALATCLEPLS